jgi:hypothetical protein
LRLQQHSLCTALIGVLQAITGQATSWSYKASFKEQCCCTRLRQPTAAAAAMAAAAAAAAMVAAAAAAAAAVGAVLKVVGLPFWHLMLLTFGRLQKRPTGGFELLW